VKAFVTGGTGFVGQWLVAHLLDAGDEVVVADQDLEITDDAAVRAAIGDARPDSIYHLAGQAHVGESWGAPLRTFSINAVGTLCVLEAARVLPSVPPVVLLSSAEAYGVVDPAQLPVDEDTPLRPVTPYAASKAAAELLGLQAALGAKVPVVRARPFNMIGPGQSPAFVVAALAQRVARAERDGADHIVVGNLTPRRDFLDVRDAARAFRLLAEHGEVGQVYNVCSGHDIAVLDVVGRLMALAGVDLRLVADQALSRPVDVPRLVGNPQRLHAATGWQPEISLDETLGDVLAYWRQAVTAEAPVASD
jgi:GDP-4-dehydro-6-deoxy-D-mannose reductase